MGCVELIVYPDYKKRTATIKGRTTLMKNKLNKWISVLLVLTLLIGPLAIADENEVQPGIVDQTVSDTAMDAAAGSSVDDSDPSANEASTSAGEGSIQSDEDTLLDGGDVISASDVDPSVGEIGEMDLTDLDGNDGDEPSGTDPIGDTQDIPFDQIVEIGDVSIRVTAGAKSLPEGSTLWADRATDEDIIQAVDAALELNGEYAHCLYRIEVRDASDNAILPFEGFDQPIVRIEGLNASNDTRVACYDSVTETAFEVDAAITDGAVEFAFVDLAIYDFIVPQISEDSSVKEQPTTEEPAVDEPSDNDQGEDASSKDGQTENSEDQTEDGKAAEQPEGDQAENDEEEPSDEHKADQLKDEKTSDNKDQSEGEKDDSSDENDGGWKKTRVEKNDDETELVILYEDESSKQMDGYSLFAAESSDFVSLPSILCVGDVYDLRKCLLFAEYSPSEVVSWKSSKPKVIRIKNGMLTALKPGKAKITVKTTDGSKRKLSLSVSANSIGGLFTKPSKSDAVALGNAFSIRPKSLKYSGTKLVAEFYLLNGYKKAITAIRGLNLTVIAGNRTNKLASQNFSKVKVKKGKKKGVSTFKVTFSNVLQNNVHLMDYSANNIYFDLDTSSVYGKAGKKTVPFVATVIPNVPAPVMVSGITLSNNELYMSVGKTTSLTAAISPDNAENKGIIWSSSNPGVATVNGGGLVTAVSEGEATITASAADGSGVSASCAVKVANENVKATSIELNQDLTIVVDQTATLTATVSPANVSDSLLEYKLSKAGIIEFTQEPTSSGNKTTFYIRALSEGSTQLTVRTIDGSDISTFCTIYVIPSTGFSVKHGSDIVLSTNSTSGTTTIDTSANNEDEYALTISSNYNWTVSASDTSWVTLNKISGSSGTSDLVLKFKNIADGNTYSTELSFIVEGTTKNIMVTLNKNNPVTSITLNQTSATLDVGDTLTLTATVKPDNALNKNVTWSSNNTSVAEVNNTGLVTAKSTGIATITAKAVDGSGKKAECKVTVGEALSKLQITNVNCSVDGEIPISKTVLWAVSTEADSDVQYEFVLLRGMKEIAHQDYGAKNFFRYTFSNPGEYTLNISCEDEDGNKASTTSNHTIQAFPLSIRSVSTKSLERILGDEITWQVETNGGHDPLSYSYELSYNGTVIDTVDSSDSSIYTYATNQAGSYVLNATCIDADATIVSLSSDAVTVVGNIATPIIRNKFGSTEADAPEYKNDAINVEWDSVSDASSYTIELSQKTGNSYEEKLKTNVSSEVTSYILQKEIFTVINSEMLYKLSLSATGIGESNADVKYFSVAPINTSLSVDSKSAITWDQASAYSSVRSFSVASDLPWSATTDVDWLSCNSMDDVTLVVSIGERTTFNGVRTGHVVVSNGNTSVTITVNQNVRTEAPEFQYPQLSTDPNNPTSFAAGPFPFRYEKNDHDYVVMKTYELQSGKWVVIRTDRGGSYGILGNKSNDTYKDDTQYKYELAGYYSKAFSENEIVSDALITTYYVFMDADKQVMTVNGVEKLTTTITNELDVDVYSTNLWTVSTDVDWITFDDDAPTKATYKNNFTIVAAVNTTGAVRTGHVYFKTDKKTATVTLTQPNTSTDIISPANISKNSNSPTTLTYGTTIRLGSPNLVHTAAILENGTWRNAYNVESYTEDETMKFQLQEADRVDGTVVRWTFSNGTSTSTYYVKVKMPSTTPYVRINPTGGSPYAGVHDWDASSGKTTLSLKLEANAAWTATSNANWLKISSTSGSSTNEKTLTVTIAANTSGAIRFGEIAFANNGVNCSWLRVTQSAGDYLQILKKATKAPYDASVDFKHENGDKGSIDLAISCNSKWSAQSNNSWLTFGSNELSISNSSSKTTSLYTSQNTTSSPRTGSVTFTCGTASTTVYITQERYLGAPIVTAPAWSTSEQSPTLTTYADVTVKWNSVSGASYYEVTNTWEHHSSFDNGKWTTIEETGKSAYSAVLPMDWFATGTDSIQYITVNAFDSYGHYTCSESLCFYMTSDAALIDGRTNQKWEKVDDKGDSNSFVITSSANWTAKSNNKWITINKTSGSNGDSLTVSVTKNTGTKRTGSVKVTVNGNTSTLTVVQCAALMDDPLINPNYALSITDATEISAGTAKITMSWTLEEQVLWYEARLYQLDDEHATQWSVIESSNSLKNKSSYTFDAYKFEAGKMYKVCLYRRSSSGNDFFYRYFTVTKPDIIIEVRETEIEVNSRECSYATNVNSGAQWFAISNNDWLMVDKHPVTQAMLDEYECDTSDYSQLLGNSGDLLYISALANTNSQPRTGSVTIRSGGATATIRVTQYQHYELAKIIEPSLSTTSEAPTLLPYMPLTVYWTKGVGGTGKYSVALYESDSQRIGYRRILRNEGITARTYVIPEYKFTENKYYNLSISTEVVEGDYYAKNYYFKIDSANPLRATLTLSDEEATVGSEFGITVSASGGTGDYRYAYQLLRKGEVIQQTAYDTMSYYTFVTMDDDIYSIRVYVKDSSGTVITVDSDYFAANQPETAVLSGQVIIPEHEYDDGEPYGLEGVTVTLTPKNGAVANTSQNALFAASPKAGSTSISVITDKYGKWVYDGAVAGGEYIIEYVKNHFDFVGNDSVIMVGNGYTSAGYTIATPTEDAKMPSPVVFDTYEDRATINLNKISSDSLTLTWNKPNNAVSYIYAVKLLNGAPSGGDDEPGISLSGTAQDRNVTTTSRKIVIEKSKLKAQKWLKIWISSVSNDGLRAQNVIYLYLSDGDAPGEVTFEGYSNNQTIYYDEISSQGLSLKWIAAKNAVKYLVSAKILDGEPTDSSDDKAVDILYNRDELVDGDHFENYPVRTVPIAKNDLKIGKWLKVAVAAVNAEGVERWSVLNLFVTSSQSVSGSEEHMNWNYWFTFDKDNCAGNTVKAGGILCIKLKANNARSFYVKLDNTEVEFSDNKFTNGVINRLVSICLRVPANASVGKHTVAVTCSNSFDRNDPNAINETRYREFTVEDKLELDLQWPLGQDNTINSHFGARELIGKGSSDHMGVDFAVGLGKPIYAAADGTVEYAGRYGGYGNYVRISHANGVKTFYGHMRDPSPWCNSQTKTIKKGDLVGYVGGTGKDKWGNFKQDAYDPHLHFGVIVNGVDTDPLRGYLTPSSVIDVNFYPKYN